MSRAQPDLLPQERPAGSFRADRSGRAIRFSAAAGCGYWKGGVLARPRPTAKNPLTNEPTIQRPRSRRPAGRRWVRCKNLIAGRRTDGLVACACPGSTVKKWKRPATGCEAAMRRRPVTHDQRVKIERNEPSSLTTSRSVSAARHFLTALLGRPCVLLRRRESSFPDRSSAGDKGATRGASRALIERHRPASLSAALIGSFKVDVASRHTLCAGCSPARLTSRPPSKAR